MTSAHPLRRLLYPRGVALVGASPDPERYNGRVVQYCLRDGFEGGIYPVNPKYRRVFDVDCYPDLASVPGPVDVVVVLVGAAQVPSLLEQCKTSGVGYAIALGDLVAPDATDKRAKLDALRAAIAQGGPRIVGPVCVGVVSPHARLAMTMSSGMLAGPVRPGGIGLVSQSGGVMASVLDRAHRFGAGFSALISSGSEFDLDLCDYAECLVDDPATRCIAIYAEKILDAPRFFAVAERARASCKPIIILKSGTSEAGARSAVTHSGAIAGDRDVEDAAFRRHGIVRVHDLDDLHMTAELLCRAASAPAGGVAAVSQSGGYCTIVADALAAAGVPLAAPTAETARRILAASPVTHVGNPHDSATGPAGNNARHTRTALLAFQDDPNVGLTLYAETMYMYQDEGYALQADVARYGRKPHVVCWQGGSATEPIVAKLRNEGVLTFDSLHATTSALSALYRYQRLVEHAGSPIRFDAPASAPRLPSRGGLLDDAAARTLLEAYGVPFVSTTVARTPEQAAEAAAALGFPVVAKGILPNVAHKTEHGLVALGLDTPQAVRQACRDMDARTRGSLHGFLVQPMIVGGVEFVLGVKCDLNLGAAIVLGLGGVFVEALGAPVVEIAPVTRAIAASMVSTLDRKGILRGYRTGRPLDGDGLVDAIDAVGSMAWEFRERIESMDLNPVIVTDRGAFAVDVVMSIRPEPSRAQARALRLTEGVHQP
jgi:acyl-CoA synthetase (NDP forming)